MKRTCQCLFTLLLTIWMGIESCYSQHDPGRNAVRHLARGEVEQALKVIDATNRANASSIDQAEVHFVRMLAACVENDSIQALRYAKEAVGEGAHFGRFLAGQPQMLQTLYRAEGFQDWAAEFDTPVIHGPMVGAITDKSARIWIRSAQEMELGLKIQPDHAMVNPVQTSSENDFTAVFEITGIEPNTNYECSITLNGKVVGTSAWFRSAPREGSESAFRIVFGGGAGFTPQHERMWDTINNRDPIALLMLGDNVYIDDPKHSQTQDYCYHRRQSQPQWRNLISTTSVFSIYDDHDFGENDCVPGPDIETPAWKRSVWEKFRENWVNPSYGGGDEQPGCWFDFFLGDVHFIMLDTRYYRDLKAGSMLGGTQKEWLLNTLDSSKGTFKVLVSSVPFTPNVKPNSKDTWDGFPDERDEIFSFLADREINGVILVSADRHRSDLRRFRRNNAYPLYEAMSSCFTNVHRHNLLKNAEGSDFIFGYNKRPSFGQLDFDTRKKDPEIIYRVFDIDGNEQGSHSIKLSELK